MASTETSAEGGALEDAIALVRNIASRQVHGIRDNDVWENDELVRDNSALRLQRLDLRHPTPPVCNCRNIAKTTIAVLGQHGFRARAVDIISALEDAERHGNNRHTIIELEWHGQFILMDPDLGVMFSHHDRYFSTLELQQAFATEAITPDDIVRLVVKKQVDTAAYPLLPERIDTDESLLAWYRPVMNTVMIGTDAHTTIPSEENIAAVQRNVVPFKQGAVKFLSMEEFRAKYYPE